MPTQHTSEMRRKIIWITFGTTMAFWFGCAGSGSEQNYKVLDDDRPMLQPERSTGGPNMSQAPGTPGTTPNGAPVKSPVVMEPVTPTPAGAPAPTVATVTSAPATMPQPSLNGLDRSAWPIIPVEPESGITRHRPVYFENRYVSSGKRQVERIEDPDAKLEAALEGAQSGNVNVTNLNDALLDPLYFARDLIMLPYRAVVTPPWETVHTP